MAYAHNYRDVVAIDFGTTYSGYAISNIDDQFNIRVNDDWGKNLSITNSIKTPTCVLTDEDGKFVALGYDAIEKLSDVMISETTEKLRFYEKFKMLLHNEKKLNSGTVVFDQNGKPERALKIFAMVLRKLAEKAVRDLSKSSNGNYDRNHIRWVITVPAIWSDAGKHFMKKAAIEAGLVSQANLARLVLALEPEAASLYCLHRTMLVNPNQTEISSLQTGDSFLLLDAGGGTLDVTVHQVLEDKTLRELFVTNGGPIGTCNIDENFFEFLSHLTDVDFLNELKKTTYFTVFMNAFERKKKCYRPGSKMMIPLGAEIEYFFEENYSKTLEECIIAEYKSKNVKIRSGQLIIPPNIASSFVLPVVKGITDHIKSILQEPELCDVSKILMAGGFSEYEVLFDAFNNEFPAHTILRQDAWAAILKGATFFGHNPGLIQSRITRKTYGMAAVRDFTVGVHDPDRSVKVAGSLLVNNVFSKFVSRGDVIDSKSMIKKTFQVIKPDQKRFHMIWFSTHLENPMYVDEPAVEKIGEMYVPVPGYGLGREVEISMKFGGTMIEVESRTETGTFESLTLELFTQ